jgi:uncharacterized membrane protein
VSALFCREIVKGLTSIIELIGGFLASFVEGTKLPSTCPLDGQYHLGGTILLFLKMA